jgi:hypothetical protein
METLKAIGVGEFSFAIALVAAMGVILTFFIMFRSQIREVLARTERLGALVLSPSVAQNVAPPEAIPVAPDAAVAPHIRMTIDQDASLRHFYDAIDADIARYNLAGAALVDLLKYSLAQAMRTANFEMIGRLIFGTQLSALRSLQVGNGTREQFQPLYEEHVRKAKEENLKPFDYQMWLNFLQSRFLLIVENDSYLITAVGRNFLAWAYSVSMNESNRPL